MARAACAALALSLACAHALAHTRAHAARDHARFTALARALNLYPWAGATAQPQQFNIVDYGAVGDNATVNTLAIGAALCAAATVSAPATVAAPVYVYVPAGVFLTGTVNLTTGVYMAFADGAWLQGSANWTDYLPNWDLWSVVLASNASATGLVGLGDSGGIEGNMWSMVKGWNSEQHAWIPQPWTGVHGCAGECRPKNLAFIDCVNVTVVSIALLYSSDWTSLYRRCHNVLLENLTIAGDVRWPNGDGLDIESGTNFTLRGLRISTGDDCIALRSGHCNNLNIPWPEPWGHISPLDGVTITNCTLQSSSCAIKMEALFQLDHGNLSNIVVDDVDIHGTNRGIGIWQRTGTGVLANISVSNVRMVTSFMYGSMWWGSGEPIVVTSIPANANQSRFGLAGIHNVSFANISAVAENGILISSRDQGATNPRALLDISLVNVSVTIARLTNASVWAQHDYRPMDSDAATPNIIPFNVSGYYWEHVTQATLTSGGIAFQAPAQPYWTNSCELSTPDSNVTQTSVACRARHRP